MREKGRRGYTARLRAVGHLWHSGADDYYVRFKALDTEFLWCCQVARV